MQHRAEMVRLRQEERLTEREIGRRLELPTSTVHYWLAKEETKHTRTPTRKGRPRVTSPIDDAELYFLSVQNPFNSAVDLRNEVMPHISVDTVRKRLKERGLRCRIPARKPFLNPSHIQKRLEFARRYQFWGTDEWAQVIFSDEKIFRSSSTGQLRVYRPRDSARHDPRYLHIGSARRTTVCVWLAFGWSFRQIHRVERHTLNADYYTTRILPMIKQYVDENEDEEFIFQQDLSSIHTSRATQHWLEANNVQWMDDWPPKGPDMNPVENVWAELVRRTRLNPLNQGQLWENVYAAFQDLGTDYFRVLVGSMRRRMQQVIAAEGRWTKY